ncbi:unnamed protein product [Aphanomyces euteiches]
MAFPAIKLTYFDFAARGETTRLPLVIGDVPFEDERLQREDWPALKASMPYKKLPVMTVDGHVLCQSLAISRYAGKLAGLYPLDNHVDACRVDEIGDFFEDIVHTIMAVLHETDAVKKETLKTQLKTDKLPEMLTMLEPRVASTSLKGPWFLDKITMADLVIYNLVRSFKTPFFKQLEIPTDISDKYTRLHEIYDAVASHPKPTPYKTVPVLTVDGQVLGHSKAIARYAAKLTGFAWLLDEVDDVYADIQIYHTAASHPKIAAWNLAHKKESANYISIHGFGLNLKSKELAVVSWSVRPDSVEIALCHQVQIVQRGTTARDRIHGRTAMMELIQVE